MVECVLFVVGPVVLLKLTFIFSCVSKMTTGVMSFAAMLKTNRTLTSLDLRGNGLVDNARRTKVVATDGFARAVVKATIYNMKPAILHLPGAKLGRVAIACRLPKEMFDQHSTNEEILKHAHTMEL